MSAKSDRKVTHLQGPHDKSREPGEQSARTLCGKIAFADTTYNTTGIEHVTCQRCLALAKRKGSA